MCDTRRFEVDRAVAPSRTSVADTDAAWVRRFFPEDLAEVFLGREVAGETLSNGLQLLDEERELEDATDFTRYHFVLEALAAFLSFSFDAEHEDVERLCDSLMRVKKRGTPRELAPAE